MAVVMAPPRLQAPAPPQGGPSYLPGFSPGARGSPAVNVPGLGQVGVYSPYGASPSASPAQSGAAHDMLARMPNPNYQPPQSSSQMQQMNTGFGQGGMQAPQAQQPYKPYNPGAYAGRAMTMPYGQSNAMTWQSIGNMLGTDPQTINNALMQLNPNQQAFAANFAQRELGIPVPGDGQGVNLQNSNNLVPTKLGVPYNTGAPGSPVSSPMGISGFNDRMNSITNMVNQRMGR